MVKVGRFTQTYFEVDMRPYGYVLLNDFVKDMNPNDPRMTILAKIVFANLFLLAEKRLSHGHPHFKNILVHPTTGEFIFIDFKELTERESVIDAIAQDVIEFWHFFTTKTFREDQNVQQAGETILKELFALLSDDDPTSLIERFKNVKKEYPDFSSSRALIVALFPEEKYTDFMDMKKYVRRGFGLAKWQIEDKFKTLFTDDIKDQIHAVIKRKVGGRRLENVWFVDAEKMLADQDLQEENRDSAHSPKGTPATLLKYMHDNKIFSDNPKKSKDMAGKRGGKNDSQRNIQRELKVLKAVGLVGGDRRTGYYLVDWVKEVNVNDIIEENPELNIVGLNKGQIDVVTERIKGKGSDPISAIERLKLKQSENVNKFIATVRMKNIQQKKIIIAWDNDIGIEDNYKQLLTELELANLGNVHFIRGSGNQLHSRIESKRKELGADADVILMAKRQNIDNGLYDSLKGRGNLYINVIDDVQIGDMNYMPILELLTFAMGIVYEDNYEKVSKLYEEITGRQLSAADYDLYKRSVRETSRLSVLLNIPAVSPIDVNEIEEMYKLAAQLLISA